MAGYPMYSLTLDDCLGFDFKPKMSMAQYLIAVSQVSSIKSLYEEEDDLVGEQAEEFCIKKQEKITHNIKSLLSSFPPVKNVDHLAFNVPTTKRSAEVIKKAVENSEEQENRAKASTESIGIKIDWANRKTKSPNELLRFENQEIWRIPRLVKIPLPKREREYKEVDMKEKKKVKRNTVRAAPVSTNNQEPRELPIEFKNVITTKIGGSIESAKLVFEKRLFPTDVNPGEGRLSIPARQIKKELFLKPEEDRHLSTTPNGGNMRVKLIEPKLEISEINLRKWNMNKGNGQISSSYVLVTEWNKVVARNLLKSKNLVQLWAFRKDSELCLALVKVED